MKSELKRPKKKIMAGHKCKPVIDTMEELEFRARARTIVLQRFLDLPIHGNRCNPATLR